MDRYFIGSVFSLLSIPAILFCYVESEFAVKRNHTAEEKRTPPDPNYRHFYHRGLCVNFSCIVGHNSRSGDKNHTRMDTRLSTLP